MSVTRERAMQIARAGELEHDQSCSYLIWGGELQCDCHVLWQHPDFLDLQVHDVR